jgi:hypothetical protein
MAMRLPNNEILALAAVPMLSVGLWGAAAGPRPAPASLVAIASTTPSTPATLPRSAVKRHRPSFIWYFFGDGGNGGANGGNGGIGGDGGGPGGGPGPTVDDGTPAGGPVATTTTRRLEPLRLRFRGFAPGDEPILHVIAPGTGRTDWPGRNIGRTVWAWDWTTEQAAVMVSRPGTYRFTITAANTATTTGLIVVKPATRPNVAFSYRRPVRRGDTVTVTVVGRRPGSPIYASLYGPERDRRLRLSRDLPAVLADRNGEGVIRWTATDAVAPGRYTTLVEPADDRTHGCESSDCDDFEVDR